MKRIHGLLLALVIPSAALAADGPPPPPNPDLVKACVKQMDVSNQWTIDWKTIAFGQPRHPQNAYERAGLAQGADGYGYPVHVVYVFNHTQTIDADYWMTHDAAGRWWIGALCRPR